MQHERVRAVVRVDQPQPDGHAGRHIGRRRRGEQRAVHGVQRHHHVDAGRGGGGCSGAVAARRRRGGAGRGRPHHERAVQPAPDGLQGALVGVVPVRSRLGGAEAVGETPPGRHGVLGDARDPVLARGHRIAVPVDRDAVGDVGVAQEHLDQVALHDGQLRAGDLPVERPGVHDAPALQCHVGLPCGKREPPRGLAGRAAQVGDRHRVVGVPGVPGVLDAVGHPAAPPRPADHAREDEADQPQPDHADPGPHHARGRRDDEQRQQHRGRRRHRVADDERARHPRRRSAGGPGGRGRREPARAPTPQQRPGREHGRRQARHHDQRHSEQHLLLHEPPARAGEDGDEHHPGRRRQYRGGEQAEREPRTAGPQHRRDRDPERRDDEHGDQVEREQPRGHGPTATGSTSFRAAIRRARRNTTTETARIVSAFSTCRAMK